MSRQIRQIIAASLVLALFFAACGDDDDSDAPTSTPESGAIATATPTTQAATATTDTGQILINGLQEDAAGDTIDDYGIWSVDSDATNLRRLGTEGVMDYFPDWSPDGQMIAFTRFLTPMDGSEPPRAVIMTMSADGSSQQMLTDEAGMELNPVWSPDGQQIAFERVNDPSDPEEDWAVTVSVMNADGSNVHDIGSGTTVVTTPSWSPDGSELVFGGSAREAGEPQSEGEGFITVVQADGSNPRQLLGSDELGSDVVLSADWSPDGSTISFVRFDQRAAQQQRTDDPPSEAIISLWAVNSDGSNPRALTDEQFLAAFFPAWSPDGNQIAFIGWEEPFDTGLYILNADGSGLRQLAEGLSGNLEEGEESVEGTLLMAPSWSPVGDWVSYLGVPLAGDVPEGLLTSAELYLVAPDGSEQRSVLSNFFVEPVGDPFDSMGSAAPVWNPGTD